MAHLVNWGHGTGFGLQGLPDWSAWVLAFGPPWPLVGLSKYTGDTRGEVLWYFLASLVLPPSWIVWWVIWSSNGSACGAKPVSTSLPVPEGPRLTIAWPCPPLRDWILSHNCPPPPGWWGFDMGSRLQLVGLLLPPGSCLGPKSEFSGVSP